MRPFLPILLASLAFVLSAEAKDELNVARPETDPYVAPEGNRGDHLYTDAEVNEARVYEFYQRQADHYMAMEVPPKLVPAFPGHWMTMNGTFRIK